MQDATLLQDMCGETWIPRNSLYNWRPLGSGAFAVVQLCMLKPEQGPAVSCLAIRRTCLQHTHEHAAQSIPLYSPGLCILPTSSMITGPYMPQWDTTNRVY